MSWEDYKQIKKADNLHRNLGMGDIPSDARPAWMNQFNGYTIEHFPFHLFPPRGAITFDIRKSVTLSSPTVAIQLIDFLVPNDHIAIWRSYSQFCNTPTGVSSEFFFKVNGAPALSYHGDSLNDYRKTLSLGNDLQGEIDALVEVQGGKRITVDASVSDSTVPATVAARIKGWLIPSGSIKLSNLGS